MYLPSSRVNFFQILSSIFLLLCIIATNIVVIGTSHHISIVKAQKKITTDFIILNEGRELGCREIKCIETPNTLLEEDRTQLTETMKRQLNVRIMKAKSIKEFQTFGFFIYGFEIELYVMRFDKENGYQLYLSQNITLSTTSSSYSNLDITLGLLLAFKV